MANKLMSVVVRGKRDSWTFNFYGDPKYLQEWRDDGLEVYVVENVLPAWVVDVGLLRAWCFLQDVWNLKNPF